MTDDELAARWDAALRGINDAQQVVLARVEESGVSAQWFGVLRILLAAPGMRMPMSRLARDLSMTSGGFTKLADRMARENLIDRRGSVGDRRVIYAALTARGQDVAGRVMTEYRRGIRTLILGVISESDVTALSDIAGVLAGVHRSDPPEPEVGMFETASRDPASPERRGRVTAATTVDQSPYI